MYPLVLFDSALITKCSIEGSLLQRKKKTLALFKKGQKTVKMSYKSVTQIIYQKNCVLYQVPLSTTRSVLFDQ
jgi:hypothetical protein